MERRFTALLLPILLVVVFLVFLQPGSQQPQAPAPAAPPRPGPQAQGEDIWWKDFGAPGSPGFRVQFDNRGGSIREIRLLDHYVSLAARDQASQSTADYYPIGQIAEPGVVMLLLAEGGERRFKSAVIDGSTPEGRWRPEQGENEVRFVLDCKDGRTLEKIFRHTPGRRDLEVELRLASTGSEAPDAGQPYPLVLRGVTLPNPRSEHVIGGNPALAIAASRDRATGGQTHQVKRVLPPGQLTPLVSQGGASQVWWGGTTNRFFAAFLYPVGDADAEGIEYVSAEPLPDRADPRPERDLLAHSVPWAAYGLRLLAPGPGETTSLKLRLYLGPKSYSAFAAHPDYTRFDPVMSEDLTPPACFCTIPGVTFMATVLLRLLEFLHGIVGNWGVAIVLLTVLVKIAVFFLNFRSQKSMRAYGAKMLRVKPELDAIQARFKDDPKKLQQEMMGLYRKHKMIPPLGGCLPMFLTIPVFFGLFTALRVSYDLRQQPFALWIQDLSAPDALFELGLPWVPHFNLLPLVWMALYSLMMFRQKLPTDPQQRMMQQMMRWMFLGFGVLLYNYASGLLVYMCTSMALAFLEQWIIKKILGPMPEVAGVASMPTI